MLSVDVHPVTVERLKDFLSFFEGEELRSLPQEAGCYCIWDHSPQPEGELLRRPALLNRFEKLRLFRQGRAHGLLAYHQGRPVGWCNAGPLAHLPHLRVPYRPPDAGVVGAVVCFLVAPAYRGQGVARALLEGACSMLRGMGLSFAEGYPLKEPRSPGETFRGTPELFREAGFQVVAEVEGHLVMRRPLG